MQEGTAVFDSQDVVGECKKLTDSIFLRFQRFRPCRRKREAIAYTFPQSVPEAFRGFRLCEDRGCLLQPPGVAAFTSEAKRIHHSQPIQQRNSSPGKKFRTGTGEADRQLQDQIGPAGKRHTRPGVFIQNGRHATLCKIAAHHYDDIIGSGKFFRFLYMISMSFVKGIIFCNNSGNLHVKSPFRIQF